MLHLLAAAAATCGVASRPAAIVTPPALHAPAGVPLHGIGTVRVRLLVRTDGTVGGASVVRGSGVAALDAQALSDARSTTFSPAIAACKAVAKSYEMILHYDPAELLPATSAACSERDRPAKLSHLQPPYVNDNDRGDGEVTLDLIIDKDGGLTSYTVRKSSGSAGLDNQVILAAKQSTYLPQLVNCVPVDGGHYVFRFRY